MTSEVSPILEIFPQAPIRKGLPFDVIMPNETTRQAFNNTDVGRNLIVCEDADDMFRELGI